MKVNKRNFVIVAPCFSSFSLFEDWTEREIDAFTEAVHKFGSDWSRVADVVRRSEQSCRAFYMKFRKKTSIADEELVCFYSQIEIDRLFFI